MNIQISNDIDKKLIKILPKYDGWIAGDDETNYKILSAAKKGNLKAIKKWGVGIDNFDLSLLNKLKFKFSKFQMFLE